MSKIGNYRIGLQESSEYQKGRLASSSGFPRQRHAWMTEAQNKAYLMGWDDERSNAMEKQP